MDFLEELKQSQAVDWHAQERNTSRTSLKPSKLRQLYLELRGWKLWIIGLSAIPVLFGATVFFAAITHRPTKAEQLIEFRQLSESQWRRQSPQVKQHIIDVLREELVRECECSRMPSWELLSNVEKDFHFPDSLDRATRRAWNGQ